MPISTAFSQTVSTVTNGTTTTTANSATANPLPPVALINLILADVNAVLPNFNGLVSSYRLLVGSAEEIRRTPEVCHDVFERAVRRYDHAGMLIDVLLELLCCKIVFSSELLSVTCGPVDLVRHLLTCLDNEDTPCRSAQTVVGLEALKRLQDYFCEGKYCLPHHQVLCSEEPKPAQPASTQPDGPAAAKQAAESEQPASVLICDSDIADIIEVKLISILNKYGIIDSRTQESAGTPANKADQKDLTAADPANGSKATAEPTAEADLPPTSHLRHRHLPAAGAKKRNKDEKPR